MGPLFASYSSNNSLPPPSPHSKTRNFYAAITYHLSGEGKRPGEVFQGAEEQRQSLRDPVQVGGGLRVQFRPLQAAASAVSTAATSY